MTASATWDVLVVAGGSARRMGGTDKVMLEVGGAPLLHRTIAAAADAHHLIVVGPHRPVPADVTWCREDPPGGGPAAAIAAGAAHVDVPAVVLLAADMPFVDNAVVRALATGLHEDRGTVAIDPAGEPQWLCSAWPVAMLRDATLVAGASLRQTLGRLPWTSVTLDGRQMLDCDTPEHVARARELAGVNVLEEWMRTLSRALGLDESDIDRDLVLDLTKDVAHNIARPAAPLTAFLVGLAAGKAGGGEDAIRAAAQKAAALANGYGAPDGM